MTSGTAAESSTQNCAAIADSLLAQYQSDRPIEQDPANPEDRRKSLRREFDCWQLVAEYDGQKLPVQRDFRLFHFLDISSSGISLLADKRPLSQELIIALGNIPFVFLHVRIVWTVPRKDLGNSTVQIGCEFVKRIQG